MSSYFPNDVAGQIEWYGNVILEGPIQLPLVGFNPGELSGVMNDAQWAVYLLMKATTQPDNFAAMMHGFSHTSFFGSGNVLPLPAWPTWDTPPSGPLHPGIDSRRIAWVERVKGASQYTPEVIGMALRLLPTGTPFDKNTYQGQIVNALLVGHEQVKITVRLAKGNIDGGNLYMQRNGDTEPKLVRFFSMRTFIDTTPLKVANVPEVRTYTYWPVVNDVQIGSPSMMVQVTVS